MTEVRFPGAKLNINVTDVGGVSITNNGEFDIPTGSTYKFKINSTDKATIDSTTLKTDKISELTSSADITLDNDVKVDKIKEKTGSAGVTIDDDLKVDKIVEKTGSAGITLDNDVKVDKIVEKTASNGVEIANYTKLSANPRFFSQLITSNQSLSSASTYVKLAFNYTDFDVGNGFNTSTNTYTFPVTGKYRIWWNLLLVGINADMDNTALSIDHSSTTKMVHYSKIGALKATDSNSYYLNGSYIISATSSQTCYLKIKSGGTLGALQLVITESVFGGELISI
jgi:hypothetical protein